jgi:phosphoglucosamine mutase
VTRLFGTDGIRGVANVDLRPPLAYALGRATASLLDPGGRLLVGQDTRRSGDMLAAAIVAGATSMGVDVHRLGVCPTPALSFVTGDAAYGAGIMVSASHNPADDNGLKVLDARGLKLEDAAEDGLEALMDRAEELSSPTNQGLGREVDARSALDRYVAHRMALAVRARGGLRVSLDCANGSGGVVAADILAATGADVRVHFNDPDGCNINLGCGATAPAALAELVTRDGSDVGFALDGDADRCVAVDERGQVIDGDQLLGIIALDRLGRAALEGSTLVVSVLSNGGLAAVVEGRGGTVIRTPVGDKYILDAMLVYGAGVGGEKSGHVIIREHATSGDGIVTALEVLGIMSRTGRRLGELAAQVPLFPQQQRAIPARHKDLWETDQPLVEAVRAAQAELAGGGRILVRPSGTEPALRIMVEGEDASRVLELADSLAALAAERLNQPIRPEA